MADSVGIIPPVPVLMGRFRAVTQAHGFACLSCALTVAIFLAFVPLAARCQEAGEPVTLRGTVRDLQGNPVAAAIVQLQSTDKTQTLSAHSDSQGGYILSGLHQGVYTLRAEMRGYAEATIPSLFLGPEKMKNIDLTLGARTPAPPAQAEFFDQPRFTVAGVTDTTSLGGHGSDTTVRTRETLAQETVALGKIPTGARAGLQPSAATEKLLREKAQRDPGSFDANHQLGAVLIEKGKAREAIAYLERATELNPGDYENAYDLALANADAGYAERARENAQFLLPHHDTAELHHLLADVQERLGKSLDAVHEYQRSVELDPREAYLFDWGAELLLHHAPEPALDAFTRGNSLFPRSVRMLLGLGATLFARGAYDQAVRRICEASDLDPDDAVPYLFLGKMERTESALSSELVERLHRFVTLQPQNVEANYYYAVSLWKARKSAPEAKPKAQIESLLKQAIRIDPKFGAAYLQLGILHFDQRDFPKAISDYQQAIHATPQLEEAHYRLAQAYRQVGKTDEAKAELHLYEQMSKASADHAERERHEIRQFVYTLRDQPVPQSP
jgi:tetratricopeptide (TPR) repeat protein